MSALRLRGTQARPNLLTRTSSGPEIGEVSGGSRGLQRARWLAGSRPVPRPRAALGRVGRPSDTVAFPASQATRWMPGQILAVAGGPLSRPRPYPTDPAS